MVFCQLKSASVCAANPTRAMKEEWNRDTKAVYGLTAEQLAEVDAQLEEIAASRALTAGPSSPACVPLADLMGEHSLQRLLGVLNCEATYRTGPSYGSAYGESPQEMRHLWQDGTTKGG